jgi:hypothetical protein
MLILAGLLSLLVLGLVVEDVVSYFRGADSYTRDFVEKHSRPRVIYAGKLLRVTRTKGS